MKNYTDPTKVITGPDTRWSYVNVWSPKSINGGPEKYSICLLIPKADTTTVERIQNAMKSAWKARLFKLRDADGHVPDFSALHLPLRDGDEEHPDDETYENCWFLNASASEAPGIVDGDCHRITDHAQVYSGVYGRASITFYAYNRNGNQGISCSLRNLQKLRDGERLGRNIAAELEFADLTESDEDPEDDFLKF